MFGLTHTIAGLKVKQLIASCAVAAAVISSAVPAGAAGPAPEPGHDRMAYQSLWASNYNCTSEGGDTTCTGTALAVYINEDASAEACLRIATYDKEQDGYSQVEYGCAPVAEGAVAVGKKLSSASLAETEITLSSYDCSSGYECTEGDPRTTTVSAELVGNSDLMTFRDKSKYNLPDGCSYSFNSKGEGREQTGSITVGGAAVATTDGFALQSVGSYKITC